MTELETMLLTVTQGITDIERSCVTNGKIITEVERFAVPQKISGNNLYCTIEIFHRKDKRSLFIYDIYLKRDPNGNHYFETFGHDSIDIDNFAEKIEKAMLYEDDDIKDLVTVFLPKGLIQGNFVDDFILKFQHITQKSYSIRPYVPLIFYDPSDS